MKRSQFRRWYVFTVPLLAALAFIYGAIRLWSIPADKVWGALILAVVMVVGLALCALVTVVLLNLIRKLFIKGRGEKQPISHQE
jgi:membrane protein implicated in regulation of membrane protease activity